MKRVVNDVEAELTDEAEGLSIERSNDRLLVKSPSGTLSAIAVRDGDSTLISYQGRQFTVRKSTAQRGSATAKTGEMRAPMPGQVVDVLVKEGAKVNKGDKLLVLEAMKVQQPYTAPFDGKVAKLPVGKGQQVSEGALLVLIEAS